MPVDATPYLQQLDADELKAIGKAIGAKITKDMTTKTKLIYALKGNSVTKQDILEFLSKEDGRTGLKAKYDGESYEKKVMNDFEKQDYKCRLNERPSKGVEFDIVGEKGKNLGSVISNKRMIAVECKNRPLVTNQDLQKFAGKFKGYKDANEDKVRSDFKTHDEPPIKGYLITSGVFEPLALEEAKKHKDMELKRLKF
jgi:hypothetical protein